MVGFMSKMEEIGLTRYALPFGHGIGLRLIEKHFVGLHAKDLALKPGHVVCWEPRVGLERGSAPGWGIAKYIGGQIVLEDDFLITEDGSEVLSVVADSVHEYLHSIGLEPSFQRIR